MVKRYLIALDIFQKACLTGSEQTSPGSFYMRSFARYLRQGYIRLYMIKHDFESALGWLNNPDIRVDLEKSREIFYDIKFVLDNVYVIEVERDLLSNARQFSTLLSTDALRLAASSLLDVDGIVSMDPLDFVQDSSDIKELSQKGKAWIVVDDAEDEEGNQQPVTMFVATPYSFLLELDRLIGETAGVHISDEKSPLDEAEHHAIKLRLQSWSVTVSEDGTEALSVTLSSSNDSYTYEASDLSLDLISSLCLAIDHCARILTDLPEFHVSYTVLSSQGLPGTVRAEIGLSYFGKTFLAKSSGNSTIGCILEAYVNSLNQVLSHSYSSLPSSRQHQKGLVGYTEATT